MFIVIDLEARRLSRSIRSPSMTNYLGHPDDDYIDHCCLSYFLIAFQQYCVFNFWSVRPTDVSRQMIASLGTVLGHRLAFVLLCFVCFLFCFWRVFFFQGCHGGFSFQITGRANTRYVIPSTLPTQVWQTHSPLLSTSPYLENPGIGN